MKLVIPFLWLMSFSVSVTCAPKYKHQSEAELAQMTLSQWMHQYAEEQAYYKSVLYLSLHADTYSTFKTTIYYSPNRTSYVVVNKNARAILYRHNKQIWSRILPHLPGNLLVTNDGNRVILIDSYYGNGSSPHFPVIIIYGKNGSEIARYSLEQLADLTKIPETTSTAIWYRNAYLSKDNRFVLIDTVTFKEPNRLKCKESHSFEQIDRCTATAPYEELKFDVNTTQLISRTKLTQGESANLKK
jgi:hypothetical protein